MRTTKNLVALLLFGACASVVIFALRHKGASSASAAPEPPHPDGGSAHLVAHGVFVWRSRAAMDDGVRMILNGASENHMDLLMPLIACMPGAGAPVTVLNATFGGREVVLDAGGTRGCTGWVQRESVVP